MTNTADRVKEVIVKQLGVTTDDIHNDSTLTELGADSLDEVEITMGIEDEFSICLIPDEESSIWRTVSDIIAYVEANHG